MARRIEKSVMVGSGGWIHNVPFCYKYWIKNEWCEEPHIRDSKGYVPDYRNLEGD